MTPATYARILLDSLGATATPALIQDCRSAASLWADSGAMWLSGHANGSPRLCPAPLAACAQGAWLALASLNTSKLDPLFSAHQLLGERAAIAGLSRQGRTSAGGACRLLPTLDGYLALNLAREDDWELMPAWLEQGVDSEPELLSILTSYSTELLVERGRLLGLAIAPVAAPSPTASWYQWTRYAPPRLPSSTAPLVVDLTSLWAGPLCGSVLAQLGARVIKVESTQRPDGARFGPQPFYQLMNAGKESVALDLSCTEGRTQLRSLLSHADIVLEAARPRALEQMGIVAADLVRERPGMTWLSITGYGRREPMREWIAYGDDAGVAAGLSWLMSAGNTDPVFCGDAVADPLTGLHAALLAQTAWQQGGGLLLDLPLFDVVSHCINAGTVTADVSAATWVATEENFSVTKPQARTLSQAAHPLGQDTARIVQEFL
jgi:hypothetical protein